MKKKSQIRKYTVQKVQELTETQQIPEMLKLYAQHIGDKRDKLKQKREMLQIELGKIRKRSQKIVEQMIDNVKDRLERKERVVMDANSRPTNQDIKNMTQLFTYMQNQGHLVSINGQKMSNLEQFLNQVDQKSLIPDCSYETLDNSFARLQAICGEQECERDRLNSELDKNRQFYKSIKQTIEQCRVKYEQVERTIAERQKELDHLVTYFQTRQREDKQKIDYENRMTTVLETELLKAQQIFNYNSQKNQGLCIAQVQFQPDTI